jgi:hypothetical protein
VIDEASATELYARGYTATRAEADALVAENPDAVAFLLHLPTHDRRADSRHPGDTASVEEWGHLNPDAGA